MKPLDICKALDIPVDRLEWTVEDWRDLAESIARFKRRFAERHAKSTPTWRCERCGAEGKYIGNFKPSLFERQAEDFKAKHADCPLSIDGGGI